MKRFRSDAVLEGKKIDSYSFVGLWDPSCFIQLSLCECHLVFTQSRYCMLVSDLLLALFHLRLLTPLHRFLPDILHILCPTAKPYCKLEDLFGAIQTQMIYQYVVIILLLTDEWMYTITSGLGCYFSYIAM